MGGYGFDDAGTLNVLNDLMKYDISTNEWTWMSGSALALATNNYGMKGVSSVSNVLGARGTYSKWKDIQGNFWLMGGSGPGVLYSDVWIYNRSINGHGWQDRTYLLITEHIKVCVRMILLIDQQLDQKIGPLLQIIVVDFGCSVVLVAEMICGFLIRNE